MRFDQIPVAGRCLMKNQYTFADTYINERH